MSNYTTWGESYGLGIALKDADDDDILMDGTWLAAARIINEKTGCEVEIIPMTIADGGASGMIDTRADGYTPGVYLYDIRVTDPDGFDHWTERSRLTLRPRVTASSQ